MGLKNTLKNHSGKMVAIHAIKRGVPLQMTGVVRVAEDDVYLTSERSAIEGPPIAQDPRTGQVIRQKEITPASTIYFQDLDDEEVILVKVIEESIEEAKAKLDNSQQLVKPVQLNVPSSGLGLGHK